MSEIKKEIMMSAQLLKKCVLALTMVGVIASCSSKKKDEAAPNAAAADSNITSQDMAADGMGSDSGKIAGLYSVNFEYDQSRLTSAAQKKLADNVAWMKANPTVNVQIEGHCDQRGSIEYNLSLGERRALAVKRYMVSVGADGNRLTTISYGKEKLLDSGDSDAAMARNRRANFLPLSK